MENRKIEGREGETAERDGEDITVTFKSGKKKTISQELIRDSIIMRDALYTGELDFTFPYRGTVNVTSGEDLAIFEETQFQSLLD